MLRKHYPTYIDQKSPYTKCLSLEECTNTNKQKDLRPIQVSHVT